MPSALASQSHRAATHVRELIRRRSLRAGDPLPSERALAEELKMGHVTVRRGLAALVDEGIIERHVGVGTFVTQSIDAATSSPGDIRNVAIAVQSNIRQVLEMNSCLSGARQQFPQREFRIELLDVTHEADRKELLRTLNQRGVHGLLYHGYLSPEDIAVLRSSGVPAVSLGVGDLPPDIPHVQVDYLGLFTQLIHEAYRFGHVELANVVWEWADVPTDAPPQPHAQRPIDSDYHQACRRFGLTSSMNRFVEISQDGIDGRYPLDLTPLLKLDPMPTCLIVNDEIMAQAVYRELTEAGYDVPRDVSLMALIDCRPHSHPLPLTAPLAERDLSERYAVAADMLRQLMDGHALSKLHVRHLPQVQFKASLAPPRLPVPSPTQTHP